MFFSNSFICSREPKWISATSGCYIHYLSALPLNSASDLFCISFSGLSLLQIIISDNTACRFINSNYFYISVCGCCCYFVCILPSRYHSYGVFFIFVFYISRLADSIITEFIETVLYTIFPVELHVFIILTKTILTKTIPIQLSLSSLKLYCILFSLSNYMSLSSCLRSNCLSFHCTTGYWQQILQLEVGRSLSGNRLLFSCSIGYVSYFLSVLVSIK
jgi:hypothetical protein